MYGTRFQEITQIYRPPTRVYPRMEWTKSAFAFPAEAGPHLLAS